MGLIFWWMPIAWLVIALGYGVYLYFSRRNKRILSKISVPIAHTSRLTDTPEYKQMLKRYKMLIAIVFTTMSLGLAACIIMTARPATSQSTSPIQRSRDIMLCLDVSGSVLKADSSLLRFYGAFIESFEGQRFGLTVFNSSAVAIVPLTSNYYLTSQVLLRSAKAFDAQKGADFNALTTGTLAGFSSGTSLASDGLATCMQYLGANPQKRSQSVILATDNEAFGKAIVGMEQVQKAAKDRNVHVYVIDPGVSDETLASKHEELKEIASETGGKYYELKSVSIGSAVNDISRHETQNYNGMSQDAMDDMAQPFLYAAALLITVSLVMMWRLDL